MLSQHMQFLLPPLISKQISYFVKKGILKAMKYISHRVHIYFMIKIVMSSCLNCYNWQQFHADNDIIKMCKSYRQIKHDTLYLHHMLHTYYLLIDTLIFFCRILSKVCTWYHIRLSSGRFSSEIGRKI